MIALNYSCRKHLYKGYGRTVVGGLVVVDVVVVVVVVIVLG